MIYGKDYKEYQLKNKGWLRRLARSIFLKNTLRYVNGKSIDFGCGAGELLSLLPQNEAGVPPSDFDQSNYPFIRDLLESPRFHELYVMEPIPMNDGRWINIYKKRDHGEHGPPVHVK